MPRLTPDVPILSLFVAVILTGILFRGCYHKSADPSQGVAELDDQALQGALLDAIFVNSDAQADENTTPSVTLRLGPTGGFVFQRHPPWHANEAFELPASLSGDADLYAGVWRVRNGELQLRNIAPTTLDNIREGPDLHEPRDGADEIVALALHPHEENGRPAWAELNGHRLERVAQVGGNAVTSIQAFRTYLTRGSFERRIPDHEPFGLSWSFHDNGSFRAWVTKRGHGAETLHEWWPDSVHELRGEWSLTHQPEEGLDFVFSLNRKPSTLRLANLKGYPIDGSEPTSVDDVEFDVEWVDGKLRIVLDGHQYMRGRIGQ